MGGEIVDVYVDTSYGIMVSLAHGGHRRATDEEKKKMAAVLVCPSTSQFDPDLTGLVKFPYTRTFDAIAAATSLYPGKEAALGISISVRKFQEAFNSHRDRQSASAPLPDRELAIKWRDDAFEKSAQIVERFGADPMIASNIRALKSTKPVPYKLNPADHYCTTERKE